MKHAGFAKALAETLPDEARAGPPEPRGDGGAPDLPDGVGWAGADPLASAISALHSRLGAVEQGLRAIGDHSTPALDPGPNAARSLLDLTERLQRLEKQVAFMSSAQAMQERQVALHTRATAADLAIKGAVTGDLGMQTTMADAWLAWLSAGMA